MSVIEVTLYEVKCDEPGCTARTSTLGGEFVAWVDAGQAVDDWISSDYYHGARGDFCDEHAARCEHVDCKLPLRGGEDEERFCEDHADDAEVTA